MDQEFLELVMHITRTRPQWGLIPLRVVFGILIFLHSLDLFSKKTLEGRLTFFTLTGWPLWAMYFVTGVTEICGMFLIPGFLTRISAGVILTLSISAALYQLIKFKTVLNLRFKMAIIAMGIVLALSGAGRYSVDRQIAIMIEEKYPNEKVHAYVHAETELPNTPWWW